jgi:hypothetical protein
MSSNERDPLINPEMLRLRKALVVHPVFAAIDSREALCRFMEVHVFAVWDFMSLVKRLQQDLTCTRLPWMPPRDPVAARLINDIVLAEESDVDAAGRPASHVDLYMAAMHEVGASTAVFEDFLARIEAGVWPADALDDPDIPGFVADFVSSTLRVAQQGLTLEVMASFFHGRENVIPGMFLGLLRHWQIAEHEAPAFVYYLQRHIELDGDAHGPAASRMMHDALLRAPEQLELTRAAACDSLRARMALWDGTAAALQASRESAHSPRVAVPA